jgi:hypothetical protein
MADVEPIGGRAANARELTKSPTETPQPSETVVIRAPSTESKNVEIPGFFDRGRAVSGLIFEFESPIARRNCVVDSYT